MKENEQFNFEFWRWHFNTDNFKQKQASIIISTIAGSRLNCDMKFAGYGQFVYDENDEGHRYPTVKMLEDFTRSKTSCLVYDLYKTIKNPNTYDKLFIYQSVGPHDGNYGYVFYNSSTGKMMHKYFIEYAYDELCTQLNKSFNTLKSNPIYAYYGRRFDSIQKRTNESFGSQKDYNDNLANFNLAI